MKPFAASHTSNKTRLLKIAASSLVAAMVSISASANAADQRIEQYFNSVDTARQGNYSIIEQVGNNNQAMVSQSYSASYQRGNFSRITQLGNRNIAVMEQRGGNNFGVVFQQGNHHKAHLTQAGNQQSLEAYINQVGHQSDIQVSQSGSGYRSISVEQQAYSSTLRPVTVETY
ncbi:MULTISPECIES: hypothetical protein [Halomonadaceae]|uniref:Minor curlin subunit n=1 Tax=Halomonas johnsoniae TaxID=502832 RepID=A0ABQ2WV58_9GAMM|nr:MULTISPECIES: hypothetical protein [Halomonas]UDM07334.1 hypothetical protein LG409_18560 [Halomonas sp. NyZ770]GGW69037.1 hypothetical protein GCM10007158_32010 [Halomonas johnsoniae]